MVRRQRAFARSLGRLVPLPDGTWRSGGVAEPMLLGAWRPRMLVPLDFEQRYSPEEREFVLAHEQAHMCRGDTVVNAVGAAWLCAFWFDPVMFWAMRLLRFDQDLACDAAVLAAAADRGAPTPGGGPEAGRRRHGIGILCAAALVAWVSLAARAVQPAARAPVVHASAATCPLSRRDAHAHRQGQSRA